VTFPLKTASARARALSGGLGGRQVHATDSAPAAIMTTAAAMSRIKRRLKSESGDIQSGIRNVDNEAFGRVLKRVRSFLTGGKMSRR
jgi:hypothetical protein